MGYKTGAIITFFFIVIILQLVIGSFTDNLQEGTYENIFYADGFIQLNLTEEGSFLSRIFNAESLTTWTGISWLQGLPYQQELPNNQQIEIVSGGVDMAGNILLFHLNNDSSFGENDSYVYDFSGNENNGLVYIAKHNPIGGKFNGAYEFDGVVDQKRIEISSSPSLDTLTDATFMAWVKIDDKKALNQVIFSLRYSDSDRLIIEYRGHPDSFDVIDAINGGFSYRLDTGVKPVKGKWYHIVVTANNTEWKYFINGVNKATEDWGESMSDIDDGFKICLGAYNSWGNWFSTLNGAIDEAAIWNRILSQEEILNIYKRGILELDFEVKSCNDLNCSGENFTDIIDISPQQLSVVDNQYFQYRVELKTENITYSPILGNVTIENCMEDWGCGDWSECINSTQARTCIDANNCSTEFNKPIEIQNCTVEEQSSSSGGSSGESSPSKSVGTIDMEAYRKATLPVKAEEKKEENKPKEDSQIKITGEVVRIRAHTKFSTYVNSVLLIMLGVSSLLCYISFRKKNIFKSNRWFKFKKK